MGGHDFGFSGAALMRVALSLTHRCNLACRYCYAGRPFARDMALATARQIVDFGLQTAPPDSSLTYYFFGGEPLLCLDVMRETTRYLRDREQALARPVDIGITTNGLLLDDAVLGFLREAQIDLCVSLDGPAFVHDRNRVFPDGRGSFAAVAEKLSEAVAALGSVQVNAVYGPDTLDALPESVAFLTATGAFLVHLNADVSATWTEADCARLDPIYGQLADFYIESYLSGREIALNPLDGKISVLLKHGYEAADHCHMGELEWGFAPSGNIYPCERLIGQDDNPSLCLGNIHTGLDLDRRCGLLAQRGSRNPECLTCLLRPYCKNTCGCTNYLTSGKTDLASLLVCAGEQAAIRAAARILVALQDNDLFLTHFMSYLHRDRIVAPELRSS